MAAAPNTSPLAEELAPELGARRIHPCVRADRHSGSSPDPSGGIEPLRRPIRGGTDGSQLTEMGLPTPNIFTGGHEYHSVREWASVQDMAAAAATIARLAEVWTRPEFSGL